MWVFIYQLHGKFLKIPLIIWLPSSKLRWLAGNTSSNGGFFHCYVSLPGALFHDPRTIGLQLLAPKVCSLQKMS